MNLSVDNLYRDISFLEFMDICVEKYLKKEIYISTLIDGLESLLNRLTVVDEDWKADFRTIWLDIEIVYALFLDRNDKTLEKNLELSDEDQLNILKSLCDLKKMAKDKLSEMIELEYKELSQADPSIRDVADDLGNYWLICPLCQEVWENHLKHVMVRCPKCHHRLYNSQFENILKWGAQSEPLKPKRYEIKYFPALGYYLYVFEGDVRIYDYFYDTWEAAIDYAQEEFGVAKDLWKKDEKPKPNYGIR